MHAGLLVGTGGAWSSAPGQGDAARLAPLLRARVDATGAPARVLAAGSDGLARHAAVAAGLPLATPTIDLGPGRLAALEALLLAVSSAQDGVSSLVGAASGPRPVEHPPPASGLAWRTTLLPPEQSAALVARREDVDADDLAAFAEGRPPAVPGHGAAVVAVEPVGDVQAREGLRVVAVGRAAVDPALGEGALLDAASAALSTAGLAPAELSAVAATSTAPALHLALARRLDRAAVDTSTAGLAHLDCGPAGPLLALHHLADALSSSGGRYALLAAGDHWGRGVALVLDAEPWA